MDEPIIGERGGDQPTAPAGAPSSGFRPLRRGWQVMARTSTKAWSDSIFGKAATAAFWQTLSLPPLLLGLLGSIGYVGSWFGPDTVNIIESKIITFSRTAFSENVVDQLISPTVRDVLGQGRPEIVSAGFLLSLWAGSSAISTFVDSIVEAHGQKDVRHPVWQRIFALLLYVMFLIVAVFVLPLVALGPTLIGRVLPQSWYAFGSQAVDTFYYPAVGLLLIIGLTTLYKVALAKSLPWHRLLGGSLLAGVFFMGASTVLRWYLAWITETGYTYGALAAPIAFLLFTFFLGFAVVLGAEFNATIQEFWPARATRMEQMREWLAAQAAAAARAPDGAPAGPVTNLTRRLTTGPMRITGPDRGRHEASDGAPADNTAADNTAADNTAADNTPADDTPADDTPADLRPVAAAHSPARNPS